ncbi:retrovirus-related pol polyprotein from transposon TNT 1-94 [Tanacetum coccineum]
MSEAEPIPPTSSVTALRIPMIKKGEYDLWSMKMRIYEYKSTVTQKNPKRYTQAASSKVQTAPNCASHSDEIICSFFAQQASMPTTHDDEDLLQIDEDAMEEIDIRWQVAMITARLRKFIEKQGRTLDLKPKLGSLLQMIEAWRFDADPVTLERLDLVILMAQTKLLIHQCLSFVGYELRGFGIESSISEDSDYSSGNTNRLESLYPNFQRQKDSAVPPPKGNPERDLKDYAIKLTVVFASGKDGKYLTYDDVEDLDGPVVFVHGLCIMQQFRIAFKRNTANTSSQSTGNTPTDSDDDVPKDDVFSTNSFDDEILNNERCKRKGVDYDEVFAPVARIEAIRLFLAFASFMGFTVYQMDVKSTFLYGNITEEVYVKQPPGFEDPAHRNKVYRVVKTLMALQSKPQEHDIMLVQVYVDDIIFGIYQVYYGEGFEDLMQKNSKRVSKSFYGEGFLKILCKKNSRMCSMGETHFFLGIQVNAKLTADEEGEDVMYNLYRFKVTQRRMSISWRKTGLLAMQETNNCGYIIYRGQKYVAAASVVLSTKSNHGNYLGLHIASALVRFIQLFLNKENERSNKSLEFSTISTTSPLEVRHINSRGSKAHSTSPHSRAASSPRDAQGTPTQSAAQASSLQGTAEIQGTAETQGAAGIPLSPNDYTPTDESQTSGGDEGLLDLYALNREVRRLKKQTISQAKQIHKLKAKLKKLSKGVKPLVKHHTLWVKSQKLKKRGKKQKKKVSSVKLGRNKDESNLSEENNDQDDHTAFVYEDFDATDAVTPDLERKSDEKDTSDVKSGDTEELDLERIQSTARQSTVTPRTLNFDDEAGPSSPIRPTQEEELEEQFKDDEFLADLNRTRGLSIPGPMQSQPQQPTQATDPKEKGKGILVEEPKKKKLTLLQIRALETINDEEVARKVQAEWDAEEERKRLEALKKSKTISKKPTSLTQERTQMMSFLKGQGYKNLQKLKYPQMKELYDKVQESIKDSFKDFIPIGSEKEEQMLKERDAKRLLRKRKATVTEEQPSKKLKLRTETIDELRNYLRIVDFEKSAQDRESLEAISMITEFKVIDSPDGEYLIIYRANNHFRAFNTLWEILHILDRQDLYHLYLVIQDYYKHIPPTGLGLILLGDLTTIWETSATIRGWYNASYADRKKISSIKRADDQDARSWKKKVMFTGSERAHIMKKETLIFRKEVAADYPIDIIVDVDVVQSYVKKVLMLDVFNTVIELKDVHVFLVNTARCEFSAAGVSDKSATV